MLRTIIGMLAVFFLLRIVWKLVGLLTAPTRKEMKSKPRTKIQKPILKGGKYVNFEEVKE